MPFRPTPILNTISNRGTIVSLQRSMASTFSNTQAACSAT
jgi:hypothetical protein